MEGRIGAGAAIIAITGGAFFHFHRAHPLTGKDTIVLADFNNKTGDPVFDGTLRQGMAVQLEQSPFLSLISEQRSSRRCGLMGRRRMRDLLQRSPGNLRANRKCRRPGRLDCKPRKPVCVGAARQELPHRRRPR